MQIGRTLLCACLAAGAFPGGTASGGVTNPDISLIGQLRSGWTDDPSSPDRRDPTLSLGEVELSADAALNPYSTGAFVFSYADGAVDVEEAYIRLDQGLPWGLALKAGKYRAPFGKVNPAHPHAYPFLDAPHVMAPASGIVPGKESWDEPAVEVSELFPGIGSWAPLLSLDLQQGSGFRTSQDTSRVSPNWDSRQGQTAPSWLAHLSNSFLAGDEVAGDIGLSAGRGTTNVDSSRKALILGGDLKLKIELAPGSRLTWQTETVWRRDDSGPTLGGGYTFLDWSLERWNLGALYEQMSNTGFGSVVDRSVKGFAGFSLMEETTLFRIAFEHRWLVDREINTASAQILFSMGPHKPHQF